MSGLLKHLAVHAHCTMLFCHISSNTYPECFGYKMYIGGVEMIVDNELIHLWKV